MTASPNNPSPSILGAGAEQFLSRLIRKKARQIICRSGFQPFDRADIEQQLRLKVEKHLSAYSGGKGHLYAFLTAVVERRAASLVRDQLAEKRDPRRTVSLSIKIDVKDEGPVELAALITQSDVDARLGTKSRPVTDSINLEHDLNAALRQLTPDERRVGEALKHGSITDVAQELGVPRATIYEMLAHWREQFEDLGLREYL